MKEQAIVTTPLVDRLDGVTGEFHSQGNLLLAARAARRSGFAADRMWFIGDPTTDQVGDPIGFTMPVSFVREVALALAVLGLLFGTLIAFFMPPQPFPELITGGLRRWLPWALSLGLVGGLTGLVVAWASLSARIGAYLQYATGGSLRLKIGIVELATPQEAEQLAEEAERVLRVARAEAVRRVDGSVEVNSPQQAAWIA